MEVLEAHEARATGSTMKDPPICDGEQGDGSGSGIFYRIMSAGAQEMVQHLPKGSEVPPPSVLAAMQQALAQKNQQLSPSDAGAASAKVHTIKDMVSQELAKRREAKQQQQNQQHQEQRQR